MVIASEGVDPKLEPGKDQIKLLSLVLKEVYCSSVSVNHTGFLAVVPMTTDPFFFTDWLHSLVSTLSLRKHLFLVISLPCFCKLKGYNVWKTNICVIKTYVMD